MSQAANRAAAETFLRIFSERDPSRLESIVGDNCVMETAFPNPDGLRISGRDENIEFWRKMATDDGGRFEVEELDVVGDRGINRWRYHFKSGGSVRGVTIFKFANGTIIEALAYAKAPADLSMFDAKA